jgi:uncharacterized protein (TIGR03437 family)
MPNRLKFASWGVVLRFAASCPVFLAWIGFTSPAIAQQTTFSGNFSLTGICSAQANFKPLSGSGTMQLSIPVSLSSLATSGGSFSGVWSIAGSSSRCGPEGGQDIMNGSAPMSGTVSPGGATSVTVSLSPAWGNCATATGSGTIYYISGGIPAACFGAFDGPGSSESMAFSLTNTTTATVLVSPASLSYTFAQGSSSTPGQLQVTGTNGSIVQVTVTTVSGGTWLNVSPASAQIPATLNVTVSGQFLSAGTYQGSITIQVGSISAMVPVTLTVTPQPANALTLAPASLQLETQAGATSAVESLTIGNTGSTTLNWTAAASTTNGGNWLGISPASGSATWSEPSVVNVTFNTAGLAAGVYNGKITVNPGSLTTTVQLVVSAAAPSLLLNQTGVVLNSLAGGGVLPFQGIQVVNNGSGALNWSAKVVTGSWLTVTPSSGSAATGSPGGFALQVNTTGLSPGSYSGLIQVAAPGAVNTPQYVSVVLNVAPATSKLSGAYPLGLIFFAPAGGAAPASQSVSLFTASPNAVPVSVFLQTLSGTGSWLSTDQNALSLSPSGTLNVSVDPSHQTRGVYQGVASLVFGDGSLAVDVRVYLIVMASSGATPESLREPAAATACTPSILIMVMRQLGNNFSASVGWPVNLEAQLADDCGNAPASATLVASFSNGDAPLALASLGNGIYSATWKPGTAAPTSVTVQSFLSPLVSASTILTGQVSANSASPPFVAPGGVVNGASFAAGAAVAPGSIISVFGSNLATSDGNGASFPLPTALAGIKLTIGGIDAPLFYAGKGQVNAELPCEITPGSQTQVIARAISTSGAEVDAVPETIVVGTAQPGIFMAGGTQGAILNVANQLVNSTNPAAAGDVIVVFCTGLGALNPPAQTGQPSSSGRAMTQPTVTVGGLAASVQYAGVAPGYVGLYQVNVVVPAGIGAGSAIPVVLTQNGAASNAGTIAVH